MIISSNIKKEHLHNAIHKIDKEGFSKEMDSNYYDLTIIQKLLPKLHGSRSKLSKSPIVLAAFCLNNKILSKDDEVKKCFKYSQNFNRVEDWENKIKLNSSFVKLARMNVNAIENGFASFAEA